VVRASQNFCKALKSCPNNSNREKPEVGIATPLISSGRSRGQRRIKRAGKGVSDFKGGWAVCLYARTRRRRVDNRQLSRRKKKGTEKTRLHEWKLRSRRKRITLEVDGRFTGAQKRRNKEARGFHLRIRRTVHVLSSSINEKKVRGKGAGTAVHCRIR